MIQSIDSLRSRGGEPDQPREPGADSRPEDPVPAPLRSRIPRAPEPEPVERLIRSLAADHLRELRDDGVTLDYMARMYGVSAERMEIVCAELLPSPPR
ncbi:MAG TPA: hypothetical protein VGR37_19615 [Longimicrobiaceae bacterium]|nr:hypothetical protein [Longimicrobiaceae bacterium]